MASNEVFLYRYDLSNGMAKAMAGPMFGMPMEGVWHTSLVFRDTEYFFDGGCGVARAPPESTPFGLPTSKAPMGLAIKSLDEFEEWCTERHRSDFAGTTYSMMTHNCNHFTHEALCFLTGMGAPDDVVNMIPNMLESPAASFLAGFVLPGGLSMLPPGLRPQRDPRARDFDAAENARREYQRRLREGNPRLSGPTDASATPESAQASRPSYIEEVVDEDAVEDSSQASAFVAALDAALNEMIAAYSGRDSTLEEQGLLCAALDELVRHVSDVLRLTGDRGTQVSKTETAAAPFTLTARDLRHIDRLSAREWVTACGWREVPAAVRGEDADLHLSPTYAASSTDVFKALHKLVKSRAAVVEESYLNRLAEDDDPAPLPSAPSAPSASQQTKPVESLPRHVDASAMGAAAAAPAPLLVEECSAPLLSDGALELTASGWRFAPIRTLEQLLDNSFSGGTPVALPAAPYNEMARRERHARRHPDWPASRQPIIVIHDFKGGFGGDAFVHQSEACCSVDGTGGETYTPGYFPLADGVVYFSHHFVSCPPPWWTTTAHAHGTKMFGTIKFAAESPAWAHVLEHGVDALVERLTALQLTYGFDGWMVVFQKSAVAQANPAATMRAFLAALKSNMSMVDGSLLLWDGASDDGGCEPQYGINQRNADLASLADVFIAHYAAPAVTISAQVASKASGTIVCRTVDVFGRGHLSGGWSTGTSVGRALAEGRGACIYAPGWSTEHLPGMSILSATERANLSLRHEAALCHAIACAITKSDVPPVSLVSPPVATLPFCTTFNVGVCSADMADSRCTAARCTRADFSLLSIPGPRKHDATVGAIAPVASVVVPDESSTIRSALRLPLGLLPETELLAVDPLAIIHRMQYLAPAHESQLVVDVAFRIRSAESPSASSVCIRFADPSGVLGTALLPLAGQHSSTAVAPAKVKHCWESRSADGWTVRRFALRQLAASTRLGQCPLGLFLHASASSSSPSASEGCLELGRLSIDVIPMKATKAGDAVLSSPCAVPKVSVLSGSSSVARQFAYGVDPTSVVRLTCSAAALASKTDRSGGATVRRVMLHVSCSTRPSQVLPAVCQLKIFVGQLEVATVPCPCEGWTAVVELSQRDHWIQLPEGGVGVPVAYQALDALGAGGGVRELRVAISAS